MMSDINVDMMNYNLNNLDVCLGGHAGGGKELKAMTKMELYSVAKRFNVSGRASMNKIELIAAIRKYTVRERRRIVAKGEKKQ
jgi:hypothetical protein